MKHLYLLLLLCSSAALGQITVDGTSTQTSLANNAPAMVVDPALTVTSSLNIPQFTVKITGFSSGDVLAINGTVPAGITPSYNTSTGVLTIVGDGTAAQYQTILRNVTFRTTSSSTTQRTIVFQAGDGSVQLYGGHYYKYVSGTYSFSTARANAAALSLFGWTGYLATITSSGENSFIFNNVGKGWLGATDDYSEINTALGTNTYANQAASEGKWYWINGPEKGILFSNGATVVSGQYASWTSGEPNNSNGENFAENFYPNNGSWNDASGTSNMLVEFGTPGFTVDLLHSRTITMIATQLTTASTSVFYQLHDASVSVDPAITGYSVNTFNAARVTISGNFKTGDALTYTGSVPGTFSGTYNATNGVLTFSSSVAASVSDWQTLFRNVKFSSTSNVVGNRTVTFSLGNQVAFSNGHFYEYVAGNSSWENSKTAAEGRNYLGLQGYLVNITSADENDFIRQKLNADAWTGASDNYSYINAATGVTTYANQGLAEGKWYWVTGPEKGLQITTGNVPNSTSYPPAFGSTYNNWNLGEPNNSSNNENGGTIYASGTTAGKWNDLNTTTLLGYVVEYGGLSTDPMLQLSASRTVMIDRILPVRDLKFNVSLAGSDVRADWSTSAEENTRNFELLHSTDGTRYSSLASVTAAGNSSVTSVYSWIHKQVTSGTHYYKLAQYDIDGAVHYSEVRTIQLDAAAFKLFPTVATSTVLVTAPAQVTRFRVFITNAAGSRVLELPGAGQATVLDVSSLNAGVYFAEIVNGNDRQVFRFVKK